MRKPVAQNMPKWSGPWPRGVITRSVDLGAGGLVMLLTGATGLGGALPRPQMIRLIAATIKSRRNVIKGAEEVVMDRVFMCVIRLHRLTGFPFIELAHGYKQEN